MKDHVFEGFLNRQYEKAMALVTESDRIGLIPLGAPPFRMYIASIRCKGLVKGETGEVEEFEQCDVAIRFPDNYLRGVPVYQVLTYLGPSPRPFHPNIGAGHQAPVCVDLRVAAPLEDILYTLYDLWSWNLYATRDEGLNHDASRWVRSQDPSRFPVDRRPLKRSRLTLNTRTLKGREA